MNLNLRLAPDVVGIALAWPLLKRPTSRTEVTGRANASSSRRVARGRRFTWLLRRRAIGHYEYYPREVSLQPLDICSVDLGVADVINNELTREIGAHCAMGAHLVSVHTQVSNNVGYASPTRPVIT